MNDNITSFDDDNWRFKNHEEPQTSDQFISVPKSNVDHLSVTGDAHKANATP
jgi:hypothetical protein